MMDKLYMVIIKDNETGEETFFKSGRNYTPFTTSNLMTAKAQVTRNSTTWCTPRVVAINEYEEIENEL